MSLSANGRKKSCRAHNELEVRVAQRTVGFGLPITRCARVSDLFSMHDATPEIIFVFDLLERKIVYAIYVCKIYWVTR